MARQVLAGMARLGLVRQVLARFGVELLYATPADVDREQARVRELEERVAALEGVFSDLLIDDEALQLAYQRGFKDALSPSEVMPCPPPTPPPYPQLQPTPFEE